MVRKLIKHIDFSLPGIFAGSGFAPFVAFFIPWLCAFNYVANHFYINGAYTQDSAYFAALVTNSTAWPMPNPIWLPGTYFTTHFCLIFYGFTFIYHVLSAIGVHLEPPVYFAVTHGLWHGLWSVAVFGLLWSRVTTKSFGIAVVTVVISIGAGLNGLNLAAMGLPHFEVGIPALLTMFFMFYLNNSMKLAAVTLLIGLLTREDTGFHYFGLFFLLSGVVFLSKRDAGARAHCFRFAWCAVVCFVASVISIIVQKNAAPAFSMLELIYTGNPPYAHLTWEFMSKRLGEMVHQRSYIYVPVLITLLVSIVRRDRLLPLAVASVIPWTVFSVISMNTNPGYLTSYYAFPLILIISWPLISGGLNNTLAMRPNSVRLTYGLGAAVIFSSIVLMPGSGNLHDDNPWETFGFEWYGKVEVTHAALNRFYEANRNENYFFVDDPGIGILTNTVTPEHRRYQLKMEESDKELFDTVLYLPKSRWKDRIEKFVAEWEFDHLCRIVGTEFIVASKRENIPECQPLSSVTVRSWTMTDPDFREDAGWSAAEQGERRTVGPRSVFPVLRGFSTPAERTDFCLTARADAPEDVTAVNAEVHVWGIGTSLGKVTFAANAGERERCVPLPEITARTGAALEVFLELTQVSDNGEIAVNNPYTGLRVHKASLRQLPQ